MTICKSTDAAERRNDRALPEWPALMRPQTLKAYLDCWSDSDFGRKLRELEKRGYPGIDPRLHRHVKAVVDLYLSPESAAAETRKARMMKAARGEVA